jgi:hypothetical protein
MDGREARYQFKTFSIETRRPFYPEIRVVGIIGQRKGLWYALDATD